MLTLLLAAINNKNKGLVKGYQINIKGGEKNRFIDEHDIEKLLLTSVGGDIKGKAISSVNLNKIEQELGKSIWVSKVEVYFDNKNQLFVSITEKEPIARIFTLGDSTFYIDSSGSKLPLSDKLSAKVPVFTGFPEKKLLDKQDSLLLNDIKRTATFILHNDFWMAQVAQIDITDDREMIIVPVVGNHLVKLGNSDHIEDKFKNLLIFYQQVLSKVGFDKYKLIDVRYNKQIVTSTKGYGTEIDSTLLRKNIEKMLQDARAAETDTIIKKVVVPGKYIIPVDSLNKEEEDNQFENIIDNEEKVNEQNTNEQQQERKPKTIMPKQEKKRN